MAKKEEILSDAAVEALLNDAVVPQNTELSDLALPGKDETVVVIADAADVQGTMEIVTPAEPAVMQPQDEAKELEKELAPFLAPEVAKEVAVGVTKFGVEETRDGYNVVEVATGRVVRTYLEADVLDAENCAMQYAMKLSS